MAKITTLFIDKGGVLIDNHIRIRPRISGRNSPSNEYVRRWVDIRAARIVERLRDFHRRGLKLHVASGDQHADLVGYLETMNARELFDRVYGSDLVNVWKQSPAYYRAILSDTRTDPAEAAVVDDSERAIEWAAACGLRGVLVRHQDGELFESSVLHALDEVESLVWRARCGWSAGDRRGSGGLLR